MVRMDVMRHTIPALLTALMLTSCSQLGLTGKKDDIDLAILAALAAAATAVVPAPTATPGAFTPKGQNASIDASWSTTTGAQFYNVYYSTSSGVSTSSTLGCQTTSTSCTISGLTNGTVYYLKVAGAATGGVGPLSSQQVTRAMAAPICGNGYLESTETCDDGNTINDGNGCSAICQLVGAAVCTGSPSSCTP
jgi:cysteine-rich repeat protein